MEPCSYMLISGYFLYHSSKWYLTFLLYLIDSFNLTFNCILSKIENERVASNNKNREEKVMAFCGENTFCIRNSRLPPQKDCCTTRKTKVQNILRRFTMHSGTEKAIKCQIWQKIDLDYYVHWYS